MDETAVMQPLEGLKTIFNPATLVRKGLCPVTAIRSRREDAAPTESHSLYFEQHGTGPERILCIMGLNSTSFAWIPQVDYFGNSDRYTILVFDNRGVGNSGTPKGPYATSTMAEDVIVLLDYVGWTEPRGVHVVGVSMGGMIAQELATRVPERLISLTLAVTTAGGYPWTNLPSWLGITTLLTIMRTKDPKQIIPLIHEMVYPIPWLDSKAADGRRTNREVQTEIYVQRIASTRSQTPMGHISQMIAGITHRVSATRLARIAATVPRITIVTGDQDHLVNPRNSEWLAKCMPEAHLEKWEGTGHAIHGQWPERFNKLLEDTFADGRQHVDDGWKPKV